MSKQKELKISTIKNYSYKAKYGIVKKARLDEIKDDLSSIFGGPKKSKKKKGENAGTGEKTKPFKINVPMIAGIFVGMLLIIYIVLLSMMPSQPLNQYNYIPSNLSVCYIPQYFISNSDVVDFGTKSTPQYSAYALVHFLDTPPKNCTANIWTTKQYIDDSVYILNVPISDRASSETISDFDDLFRITAHSKGLSVNTVSIQELDNVPSYSILIIPTGYFPKQLIDTGVLNELLSKNINIIYIGNSFDQGFVNAKGDITSGVGSSTVGFSSQAGDCNGLSLSNPLYTATSGQGKGAYNFGAYYGCISFYKYSSSDQSLSNGGMLLFVPQSLDTGWDNYKDAVSDIIKIVVEQPWSVSNSIQTYNCSSISQEKNLALFSKSMSKNYGGVVVSITSCNKTQYTLFNAKKSTLGHMYAAQEGVIVPFEMSTKQTMFWVEPISPISGRKKFYIDVYKDGKVFGKPMSLGYLNTNTGKSLNSEVHTEKGNYLFALRDDQGNQYAKLYLRSTFADISYKGYRSNSLFSFEITKDGVPYKLKYVTLNIDNGLYKFNYSNVDSIDVQLPNDLHPGNHVFTFTIGQITKTINISVVKESSSLFSDPMIWGAVLISVLLFGVGYIFEKKDVIKYSLDIPDFIPSERRHIELPAVKILELFDKINEEYGWDHTPLKANEIRREILKIIYNSRQVNITEYNTETVLSHLCQWGYIFKVGDYYVPLSWVKDTKRSPKYLAIFRRLRDSCIKNAIHFTEFNKEKNVDSILNINENKIYVHIVDDVRKASPRVISRALKLIPKGINVILFYDSYSLEKFNDILLVPDVPNTLLKLESDFWSVILTDFSSLDKILRKIKFM